MQKCVTFIQYGTKTPDMDSKGLGTLPQAVHSRLCVPVPPSFQVNAAQEDVQPFPVPPGAGPVLPRGGTWPALRHSATHARRH